MENNHYKRRPIEVSFVNKDSDYKVRRTEINGTDQEIIKYYLGKWFNFGIEEDSMYMAHAIRLEDTGEIFLHDDPELFASDRIRF